MKLLEFLKAKFEGLFKDATEFPTPIKRSFLARGAIITNYGQTERKLYFINRGLVQLTILHDGEERIVEFFSEDSFVCAFTSFLRQEPSDVRLTALTECEMEVIHHGDLQQAYCTSLMANKIGRVLTEEIYMHKTKREKDFLTKSAQERYAELISTRPNILKFVPVNKIAKYLGVHPESLSRIRRSTIS